MKDYKDKKNNTFTKKINLKKAFVLLLFFTLNSNSTQAVPPHEFYVSVTELRLNAEKKELQITFTLFWDDWQRYLEDVKKIEPRLTYKDELPEATQILSEYLKQHFSVTINGKVSAFQFLGREYEVDVMHCYLLIENVENLKTISLRNTYLTEYQSDQQNIMHVITSQGRKSVMTDADNPNAVLNF